MNGSSLRAVGALGLATALALTPASLALAEETPTGTHHDEAGDGDDTGTEEAADLDAQLERVRRATARYQNVRLAEADGYTLGESCITGLGYHFVREVAESQEELAITEPNSMVYVPQEDGSLKLAAVGYVSKREASLFGEEFTPPATLPYYTLHAWVWEENPNGVFEHINPNISCPGRDG
ncbi:hypothetical protein [Streptomyces millisiae]|uniref:Secreted protein n=1 Tax=Streptomyces millisiae TaxID=3075542 RepID=A0ABU2LR07_9ACTN|nr:hypothetical protein [Streptomyces sp. DSM 44918]MDT0319940.1 hypothetical protein [Streptomyces sp. DSM 44918]